MSTVSIGIDYSEIGWKFCLLEHDKPGECRHFRAWEEAFNWLAHTSALYPDLAIGLSSPLECALSPLSALPGHLLAPSVSVDHELSDFLIALSPLSRQSYCLPSVKYISSTPAHRRLLHPVMGASNTLCSIATLLYNMRQNQASWSEMRFLCLEVGAWETTMSVVWDGLIIDSGARRHGSQGAFDAAIRQEAFWEGLLLDLGGLMAVHHFEDIVISQSLDSAEASACKEQVTQRLGDLYQCYLYPQNENPGFEVCIGAALLVSGLSPSSPSAELSTRLLTMVP